MNNLPNLNICIIIVSFNRLKLLTKLVSNLQFQTYKPKEVYIYDNHSDFSIDELRKIKMTYESEFKINFFRSKVNEGGSGGFSNALKNKINENYDFFWLMDDDVIPQKNALEVLVRVAPNENVIMPIKYWKNQCVDLNSLEANFANPFLIDFKGKLIKNMDIKSIPNPCYVKTISFEGVFIKKSVIYDIGLPMNNFFICHDDLEYSLRISSHNYKIRLLPECILQREYDTNRSSTILSWKSFYVMRNYLFLNKSYGHRYLWIFRPFIVFLSFLFLGILRGKIKHVFGLLKGFINGFTFKGTFEYPSIN